MSYMNRWGGVRMHSVQFVSTIGPGHLYFIKFFLPDSNFEKHKHTRVVSRAQPHVANMQPAGQGRVRTARRVRRRHASSSCCTLARLPTSRPRASYPSDVCFHLSPSSRRGGVGVPAHVQWHGVADLWVCFPPGVSFMPLLPLEGMDAPAEPFLQGGAPTPGHLGG